MSLALIVSSIVLVSIVIVGVVGYLIDASTPD